MAAAALESAESDKIKCESLTHLARAHHAIGELEAAFKYYRQVGTGYTLKVSIVCRVIMDVNPSAKEG